MNTCDVCLEEYNSRLSGTPYVCGRCKRIAEQEETPPGVETWKRVTAGKIIDASEHIRTMEKEGCPNNVHPVLHEACVASVVGIREGMRKEFRQWLDET